MEQEKQDTLARAYATLKALRNNIDKMKEYSVPEKYFDEFLNVLAKLEGVGIETAEFRVPDSEVKPKVISAAPVNNSSGMAVGIPRYSDEKYVDKSFILTKLDAILGYFEIITSEKPRRIGFTKSDE